MAFTEAQRVEVRRYLGWPSRYFQVDTRLETGMNSVEMHAETKASVEATLAALAVVEAAVTAAYPRLRAKQVGSIALPGGGEIGMLRSEGRRLTHVLAGYFGVEVRPDAVFGGGVGGDNYMRHG